MQIRAIKTKTEQESAGRLAYDVYVREFGILGDIACHERQRLEFDGSEHTEAIGIFSDDGQLVGSIAAHFWADAPFPELYVDAFQIDRLETLVARDQMAIVTRLIVRPECRGKKLALRLMHGIWQRLHARGVELVLADCQPHMLSMYRRVGFRPFAQLFNYGGDGVGIPLAVLPADREHLVQNRSVGVEWVPPENDNRELARRFAEHIEHIGGPGPVYTPDSIAYWKLVGRALGLARGGRANEGEDASLQSRALHRLLAKGFVLNCRRGDQLITERQAIRPGLLVLRGELALSSDARSEPLGVGGLTNGRRGTDGVPANVVVTSERAHVLFLGNLPLDRFRRSIADVAARMEHQASA